MTSPNLAIAHITAAQAQKEVTANEAVDKLDLATQDTVDIDTTAGGTIAVTATDYRENFLLRLIGAPAADFTLQLPDGKRVFAVQNASGQTATITTTTGSTPTITLATGQIALIGSKGTDLVDYRPSRGDGALVVLSTNLAVPSATWTVASWATVVRDTHGLWSAGAPERFTIPAGIGRARLFAAGVFAANATGYRTSHIAKNGGTGLGNRFDGSSFILFPALNGDVTVPASFTSVVDVVPGDYFDFRVWQNSGAALNVQAQQETFFSIEVFP